LLMGEIRGHRNFRLWSATWKQDDEQAGCEENREALTGHPKEWITNGCLATGHDDW